MEAIVHRVSLVVPVALQEQTSPVSPAVRAMGSLSTPATTRVLPITFSAEQPV